ISRRTGLPVVTTFSLAGNVLGMMPHPERAVDELLGGAEGLKVFQSILKQWRQTLRLLAPFPHICALL
ncbi:hypothetical protein ACT453_43175, partial [Bacillus sp. D-CC]